MDRINENAGKSIGQNVQGSDRGCRVAFMTVPGQRQIPLVALRGKERF